jgi:predicted RNA-binding protein YlxR (DUF448 family)
VEPQRTCIGCRRTQDKAALIRVVWRDGVGIVVDREQRLPGRGCYVYPECVETALHRKAFGRALRRVVDPAQAVGAVRGPGRTD